MRKRANKKSSKKKIEKGSSTQLKKNLNLLKKQGLSFHSKGKKVQIKNQLSSGHVIFMYNSHEWDAYEVLGLPEGSSMEEVKRCHKKALLKVDKKSRAFFNAAYEAILMHRRPSSNRKN